MPLTSFKLANAPRRQPRHFTSMRTYRVIRLGRNIISIIVVMLTGHCVMGKPVERMRTNHVIGLGRNIISFIVAMLTGFCVMGKPVERMRIPINDFCSGCGSAKEDKTVIHFCCSVKSFSSPTFVSLTELSSVNVKLSCWFSSVGLSCFKGAALVLIKFFLPELDSILSSHVWSAFHETILICKFTIQCYYPICSPYLCDIFLPPKKFDADKLFV